MIEQLQRLIELQQIDSKILTLKQTIDSFPARLAKMEIPFKESLSSFESMKTKLDSFEKRKRDKERELDDFTEKINKLKTRTSEIKTNKEYQALLKEIESVEHEQSSLEDTILAIMEEIDVTADQIKKEEEKLAADKEKLEALRKKIDQDKSGVEKELLAVKESRSKIVDAVDRDLYSLYIDLLETNNGMAVTEVKGEICQGCNMNIPPQLFVEIKKNEEIITCPQCRRILYYKNTT